MYKVALAVILVGASLLVINYQHNSLAFETFSQVQLSKEAPKLRVDQSNTVTDPEGLGLGTSLYGQSFIPKANNLAQVDLLLTINLLDVGVDVTIGLFTGTDITVEPIATAHTFVAPHGIGELARIVSFTFDPPVLLAKKTTYTIGCQPPYPIAWQFSYGNPYPYGELIIPTYPLGTDADFVFTTYTLKP